MRVLPIALVMSLVLLDGCARKANDVADHGATGSSRTGTTLDGLPAVFHQPAIGPRDSLMRTLAVPLREWVRLWKAARPEFELDSLRFARWEHFHPAADEAPWEVPDSLDESGEGLNALVVVAPGGRRRLLIDRYQVISGGEIGGDPDSAPVLADLGTGHTFTFESCGTVCGFHWAAWIDSTRFVLAGWESFGEQHERSYGTLTYYDLRRGLQANYAVPVYEPEEYDRYLAAWHGWVLARLRRLSTRPRA